MAKNVLKPLFVFLLFLFLFGFAGAKEISDKPIDVFKLKAKPFTGAKLGEGLRGRS